MEATVGAAEATLAQAQIDLEITRTDLGRLTRLHHTQLGSLYDRLDELDLLIAEAEASASGDSDLIRKAYELRYGNGADPMAHWAANPDFDPLTDPLPPEPPPPAPAPAAGFDAEYASTLRFTEPDGEQPAASNPAKAAQRLYRELARKAHPDLAQEPVEKERRNAFIARVNEAYRRIDLYELQRLAEEWAVISSTGPEPESPQRELWLRQRLIWLRARTAESRVEQETLLSSPLGRVLAEFGAEHALEALAAQLWDQIRAKEAQLEAIRLSWSTPNGAEPAADGLDASEEAFPETVSGAIAEANAEAGTDAGAATAPGPVPGSGPEAGTHTETQADFAEPAPYLVESFDQPDLAETVVVQPVGGFWN